MNIQDIRLMYEYNYWANRLLLSVAEKTTPEQFTAPSSHSFGSLQGTLVHTMDVEWSWRLLLQGRGLEGFSAELKPADFPGIAAVQARWQDEELAMRDYLAGLRDEDLAGVVSYTTDEGVFRERVVWHVLYHIVNHGMQHRSEAAALLTGYDQSPGNLDFTRFLNERPAPQK